MRIFTLLVFKLTLLEFCDGGAKPWDIDDFPNPQTDPQGCGRQKPSFICDPSRVLTAQQGASLDWHIEQLTKEAPCACSTSHGDCTRPFPASVVFLPHIPSFKQKHRRRRKSLGLMEEFAHFLRHHRWRFGQCSDDIIIIVNTHTLQIHSSLGHVTKHKIKETCNQKILQTAKTLGEKDSIKSVIFILQEYRYILHKKNNMCQNVDHLALNVSSLREDPVYSFQKGEDEKEKEDSMEEETDRVGIGVNQVVAFVFVPLFGIVFIAALCFYLLRISQSLCCYNVED